MNKKLIATIVILIFLISIHIIRSENKYKDEIGGYDIYTIVMLEHNIEILIVKLEEENRDLVLIREYQDRIRILSDYLRRSPALNFMTHSILEIASLDLEDIDQNELARLEELRLNL